MNASSADLSAPLLAGVRNPSYDTHPTTDVENLQPQEVAQEHWLVASFRCIGPGLMLGFANASAGDLLAAAQAGARYRFLYLTWVVLLACPEYVGMELVTRICVVNNKTFLSLIAEACGKVWALMAILVLVSSCMGGLVMQISTIVAIGDMWGVGGISLCLLLTAMFVSIVLADSVPKIERFGICVGLFECIFCASAWLANPDWKTIAKDITSFNHTLHLDLSAVTGAMIGAALEPWVIFYQGFAATKSGGTPHTLGNERIDLFMGTLANQLTIGGILITFAVAGIDEAELDLSTVSFARIPTFLNNCLPQAKLFFSMGMLASAFVASLTIALTIAWAIQDVVGMGFFGEVPEEVEAMSSRLGLTAAMLISCMVSLAHTKAVSLAIMCHVMNALTVLLLVIFLLYLCQFRLPQAHAVVGKRKVLTFVVMLSVGTCGIVTALRHVYTVLYAFDPGGASEAVVADPFMKWRLVPWHGDSTHRGDAGDNSKPFIYFALALPMVVMQLKIGTAKPWWKSS